MKRSTAQALSLIISVIAVIIFMCTSFAQNEVGMLITCIIFFPIILVLNYFQRCRHCGRWPHKGDFMTDGFCPRCGKPYDD